MAARQALTAVNQEVVLNVAGLTWVGFGITGTWVGTIEFYYSNEGVTYYPLAVQAWPWLVNGTTQNTTTVNGSFVSPVFGFPYVKAVFTAKTSGTPIVRINGSNDGSFQNAYLTAQQQFSTQAATEAVNTLVQAARTGAAWRLKTLNISLAGSNIAWATTPNVQIKDGSTLLWGFDLPPTAGDYSIALPVPVSSEGNSTGGLVNTPSNTMTVQVAALTPSGGSSSASPGQTALTTNIAAEWSVA
jgi:hypothetical protein